MTPTSERLTLAYVQSPRTQLNELLRADRPLEVTRRTQVLRSVLDDAQRTVADRYLRAASLDPAFDTEAEGLASARDDLAQLRIVRTLAQEQLAAANAELTDEASLADDVLFPVAGDHEFTDSFLAPRAVGGRFHHRHQGADIFAPAGTPLVAVERGVLFRLGYGDARGHQAVAAGRVRHGLLLRPPLGVRRGRRGGRLRRGGNGHRVRGRHRQRQGDAAPPPLRGAPRRRVGREPHPPPRADRRRSRALTVPGARASSPAVTIADEGRWPRRRRRRWPPPRRPDDQRRRRRAPSHRRGSATRPSRPSTRSARPTASPRDGLRLAPRLVVDEAALVVLDVAAAVERLAVERTEFRSRIAAVDPDAAGGLDPAEQRLALRSLMVGAAPGPERSERADRTGDGVAVSDVVVSLSRTGWLVDEGEPGGSGARVDVVS